MKYKAIWAYIKDEIECHNGNDNVVIPKEILKVCVEALEKQIPKKPEIIEGKMWVCPNCNNNLLWLYEEYPEKKTELNKGLPFCLSCGQAIDWEVSE